MLMPLARDVVGDDEPLGCEILDSGRENEVHVRIPYTKFVITTLLDTK